MISPQLMATTSATLQPILEYCDRSSVIGFDTEFTSFPLYQPKVRRLLS